MSFSNAVDHKTKLDMAIGELEQKKRLLEGYINQMETKVIQLEAYLERLKEYIKPLEKQADFIEKAERRAKALVVFLCVCWGVALIGYIGEVGRNFGELMDNFPFLGMTLLTASVLGISFYSEEMKRKVRKEIE